MKLFKKLKFYQKKKLGKNEFVNFRSFFDFFRHKK